MGRVTQQGPPRMTAWTTPPWPRPPWIMPRWATRCPEPAPRMQASWAPALPVTAAAYRLDDPGVGLRDHQTLYGRRVLTYADLRNRYGTPDPREPEREIQLHLTGNMARYLWSFDGIRFADAEPLRLRLGERLRITLVNDTMMHHPIHLHGMWSDLETGDGAHIPRKHTVSVPPGARISYLVRSEEHTSELHS